MSDDVAKLRGAALIAFNLLHELKKLTKRFQRERGALSTERWQKRFIRVPENLKLHYGMVIDG